MRNTRTTITTRLILLASGILLSACSFPAMGEGYETEVSTKPTEQPRDVNNPEVVATEEVPVQPEGQAAAEGQATKEIIYVLGVDGMD